MYQEFFNEQYIHSIMVEKYNLEQYINKIDYLEESKNMERYLTWASNHKFIAVSKEELPVGILPNGRHGELYDLKIKVSRGKPDDELYDQNEELRKNLARGNSVLHVIDGPQAGFYLVLFALRKFTSKEAFDDDDRQDAISNLSSYPSSDSWKLYFTKPIGDAVSVICTEKVNGESAHLSCIYIEKMPIIVAGSKNVHLAFSKKDDIERYHGERYRMAKEFSYSIMEMLDNLPPEKSTGLLEFLAVTRFTAVFEILCPKHQHIENISHLNRNRLKFITWTINNLESSGLTSLPPDVSIDIAREFGLDAINYTKLPANEETIIQRVNQVRLSHVSEGEVHYYIDADGNTIGLAKVKSIWYIFCRAIREKVKVALSAKLHNPAKYSHQATKQKVEKRLGNIQSWLKLTDEVYRFWLKLALDFIAFIVNEGQFSLDEVGNLFPLAWKTFLDRTNQSDQIKYSFTN